MKSLYARLQNKEEDFFGEKDYRISSNIKNHLIPVASTLLGRMPAYMPEYTLHDIKHCERILSNICSFLPSSVDLNIVELTILIYSVYLHDIGMVVSTHDAMEIKSTSEFKNILLEFEQETDEDEILTEFIRRNHVIKSTEYVDYLREKNSIYKVDFDFMGSDLAPWIKNVILSHAYPVQFTSDIEKFPTNKLIHQHTVNVQFIALLLRLGDILDFDLFRTPPFLYDHINPQNKISIMEWKKHQAIEGFKMTDQTISFEAFCTNSKVERAVRNFVGWIEKERHDTMNIINQSVYTGHKLNLTNNIDLKVRNDGSYIFSDLELHLDYEKVLNILMGTELYDSPDVFIREVLQNSYDACKLRSEIFSKHEEPYFPKISIRYDPATNIVEIEDNGVGIDDSIFENYLLKIGRSYYKSKIFESQHLSFEPISNFGIGILSCFMVSNSIEIESLKAYSPIDRGKAIHYILSIDDHFVEQKESNKKSFGTIIRLSLRKDYALMLKDKSILELISDNILLHEIPLHVTIHDTTTILNGSSIEIPSDLEDISDITVLKINDIDWLHGYVIVHRDQHQSFMLKSRISQQCFAITSKNSNLDIAPKWLRHCKFLLNINPPHKLRLKANRNKVHEDEKLSFLRTFITEYLIDELLKLPDNKFLIYLTDGKTYPFSGNKKEFLFLINHVPFEIITNKFQLKKQTFGQMFSSLLNKQVVIINRKYLETAEISKKIGFIFQKYSYILLQWNFYEYFVQFARPYLLKEKLIVTGIPGVILYEYTFKHQGKLEFSQFQAKKMLPDLIISYQGSDDQIFCIVGNRGANMIDFHFNNKHRLGQLLDTLQQNSYIKRFKGSFKTNINLAIENKVTLSNYTNYNGEFHTISRDVMSGSLNSIGILMPEFITSLNAQIKDVLLIPLTKEGLVASDDIDNYLLEESDFPAWWFKK